MNWFSKVILSLSLLFTLTVKPMKDERITLWEVELTDRASFVTLALNLAGTFVFNHVAGRVLNGLTPDSVRSYLTGLRQQSPELMLGVGAVAHLGSAKCQAEGRRMLQVAAGHGKYNPLTTPLVAARQNSTVTRDGYAIPARQLAVNGSLLYGAHLVLNHLGSMITPGISDFCQGDRKVSLNEWYRGLENPLVAGLVEGSPGLTLNMLSIYGMVPAIDKVTGKPLWFATGPTAKKIVPPSSPFATYSGLLKYLNK